jgi:hypothetical protein
MDYTKILLARTNMKIILLILCYIFIACDNTDFDRIIQNDLANLTHVFYVDPKDLEENISIDKKIEIIFTDKILKSSISSDTFIIAPIKDENNAEYIISELSSLKSDTNKILNNKLNDRITELIEDSLYYQNELDINLGLNFEFYDKDEKIIIGFNNNLNIGTSYIILIKGLLDKNLKPVLPYVGIFKTQKDEAINSVEATVEEIVGLATSDLIINEILADPPDDANGDGVRDSYDDEFIEIVNARDYEISLKNVSIAIGEEDSIKHIFTKNDKIPPLKAIVIFGGGTPNGDFGGSSFYVSDSSLRLSNSGNTVYLILNNVIIDSVTYGSEAGYDQSLTRFPDITGSFIKHTEANTSFSSSPGKKTNQEEF